MALYNFSFGSNMSSNRLLARLPNAKRVGTALLKGYKLTFNMAFADGSGKCTIVPPKTMLIELCAMIACNDDDGIL